MVAFGERLLGAGPVVYARLARVWVGYNVNGTIELIR